MRTQAYKAVVAVTLLLTAASIAQKPATLRIGGTVLQPLELTAPDLAKMTRFTLDVPDPHSGITKHFSGVRLSDLLAKAGAPLGDNLRGKALAMVVIARASDEYVVVYSLAEVDPAMSGSQIFVADTVDGKPLDQHEGPFRVIVPGEKRPARWIRMVTEFELASPVNPSGSSLP